MPNPAKSAGPDDIPSKFLAISAQILAPVLVELYNNCIIKVICPNTPEVAKLYPFIKMVLKIFAVITDPYQFLVHSQKFLKNVFMIDYIHILKNITYLHHPSLDFKKIVPLLMQLDNSQMRYLINLMISRYHVLYFLT